MGPMTIGSLGSKMKSGKKCMTFGSDRRSLAYQLKDRDWHFALSFGC
jgi:hypothetical protein